MAVAQVMIEKAGVSCLPGSFFIPTEEAGKGSDRWLRFSVPNVTVDQLQEVGDRLKEFTMD